MRLFANLHAHSTHSDGVYSPKELVRVAAEEGYRAVAVTDHDTATGYPELAAACRGKGLDSIFGVEFTGPSDFARATYHIVGFGFDPSHPKMAEYLRGMSFREADQTRILFERGLSIGFLHDVTWQEVLDFNDGISWLCNEHVFRLMKAKGLAVDTDYPEFFKTVYGPHRGEVPPAYPFLPAHELIALIREAGGVAVLAHPHGQLTHVPRLLEYGLSGVEVWHHLLTDEERKDALDVAEQYGLLVSGGEDHDGLCGGEYARFEHPEETKYWIEPLSCGTTEFFFRELLKGKISPDRTAEFRRVRAAGV